MKKTVFYLTYIGAFPFIFGALCLSLDVEELPLLGSVEKITSVYALVISSFLAGVHWGQHFQIQGIWSRALPILSTTIVVLLWFGFLVLNFKALIGMFIATFSILLVIDYRLFQSGLIIPQYFQTRCFVSIVVIISLIISGIAS